MSSVERKIGRSARAAASGGGSVSIRCAAAVLGAEGASKRPLAGESAVANVIDGAGGVVGPEPPSGQQQVVTAWAGH